MSAPVLLLVDAGNTRIKWGLSRDGGWIATGSVDTADGAAFADAMSRLPEQPVRAVGCNVAGATAAAHVESALSARGLPIRWNASCERQAGVSSGYDRPGQLGADRWAAMIGAYSHVGGACLVVNAGTAITLDALDRGGRFLGGRIMPGIDTMLDALEQRTAGLRRSQGAYRAFPANTADAMMTGAIDAAAGAVLRAHEALRQAVQGEVPIVLSGGAADTIAEHLAGRVIRIEQLVLEGLRVIAEGQA
ncbi:MAG: type III pantothenate kinase [Betaproteobacteria bacterium]|nr:type III pantothenate kinase [Betaproteobacteria bacterium]